MIKSIYKTALFSFLLFFAASCKKTFLDVYPTLSPAKEDYVNNITSSKEFLNGIYTDLGQYFYQSYNAMYADIVADNIKPKLGSSTYFSVYSWNQGATDTRYFGSSGSSSVPNMNGLWTIGYKAIRSCNYLLENIDRFHIENAVEADNIKGQAYALRAIIYHTLVTVFSQPYQFTADASHPGVPYVTSSDALFDKGVARKTVGELYGFLINDFNAAIPLLNPAATSKLYVTKNTAKAFLARVYLYKGDFTAAKGLAVEVLKAVPIINGSSYVTKLFTANETEALLQIPPAQTATNNYATNFPSYYFRTDIRFFATKDITDLINERAADARKVWVKDTAGASNIRKFPSGAVSGITTPSEAYYLTVIRSSEMCLTAAEALAKIGKEDSAKIYLDYIRQRADGSATNSTATGAALMDSIYKERRKELCFENFRMFDLLRTGKPVNRIDITSPATAILPYPSNKAIAPIPLQDIQSYGLQQNTGY